VQRTAGDGRSLLVHLLDVEKQTGRKPESLAAAQEPLPDAVAYILDWFYELNRCRSGNGFGGINRITYTEIAAWASLTGRIPTAEEVECLLLLDGTYITTILSKESTDG
jgi:hypothetical protein